MAQGYSTLEDLRRALREADLPGDLSQDEGIAVDAITAQTEWLEKTLKRHWYEPDGIDEATAIDIPTSTKSRDDEEDIPTGGAYVSGDDVGPKQTQGSYTHLELDRRDADTIEALHVRTADGTFEDWVASSDYTEGSWPPSGEDYYLRVNNGGWSRLYLDTDNFWDEENEEWTLDSFASAVYVEFAYGHEGIPQTVRRAVAFRAASDFVEKAAVQIPENARVSSVEALADKFERKAEELLEVYQ